MPQPPDETDMRVAIYYAPGPQTALHELASAWLGRDAWTGRSQTFPRVPDLHPRRVIEMTKAPRHYGFHATLKPPFRLAAGRSFQDLLAEVSAFAAEAAPAAGGRLVPIELGGFVALGFERPTPEVDALAAACVARFDAFRAPPTTDEIARRGDGLAARQRELLVRWGYPFVMEEFRFHMTLTDRLDAEERHRVVDRLSAYFAEATRSPVDLDALCLFVQPAPEKPFVAARRVPLAGSRMPSH